MPDTTITVTLPTGWSLYTQIFLRVDDGTELIWNGTAFVDYSVDDWATYATATPETGTTGGYVCQFPLTADVGQYQWITRRQTGGSPSSSDPNVTEMSLLYTWTGSTLTLGGGGGGSAAGQPIVAVNEILSQAIGTDKSYDVTVRDDDGNPITTFTGDETLACKIWAGQDQVTLSSPAAAWLVPGEGTVRIAVASTDLADIALGLYRMSVTLTNGSATTLIFDGSINVTSAPGTTVAPLTYCTFEDMRLYAPQIQNLQDPRSDTAGFLANRARALTWTNEHCLDGYRPNYGRARRYVSPDGTAAGPHLRWVTSGPNAEPTPTIGDLRTAIDAGGLRVTALVREANAHMAAAIVYLNQPGSNNPYHQNGAYHAAKAMSLLKESVIEVDLDDDAAYDVRIGQDVTWLN